MNIGKSLQSVCVCGECQCVYYARTLSSTPAYSCRLLVKIHIYKIKSILVFTIRFSSCLVGAGVLCVCILLNHILLHHYCIDLLASREQNKAHKEKTKKSNLKKKT